jgi:hypothetical protein
MQGVSTGTNHAVRPISESGINGFSKTGNLRLSPTYKLFLISYLFAFDFQFRRIVIGGASLTMVSTRQRWPSGAI